MSKNLLRRFDQFRRRHTVSLNAWLYGVLGRDKFLQDERLARHQVQRILVLRNNPRIGNMYFLLPFMNALRQAYPSAEIELMVISPAQAKIFEGLGLANIWVSRFSFKHIIQFFKILRQCRARPYDLLLMPHGSTTDTIIGGLIHARNKACLWDQEKTKIYRHAVRASHISPHAALSPLALLEALTGETVASIDHQLRLNTQEVEVANAEVGKFRRDNYPCIAYFRGARGNKIITDEQWHKIRQQFDASSLSPITWIEILSPDVTSPLTSDTLTWQSASLRDLGAFLAACDLFICGDTGPLHLADASGAACVGLYTATSPEHYGCMGDRCWNITDIERINTKSILLAVAPTPQT